MKKVNKVLFSFTMILVLMFPSVANAYVIDNTYQLTLNEGDSRRAANKFIILHEVGTESSAINNAIYMKRAWSTNQAYTQFIVGDGGKVYKVGEDGYVSWGAGSYANANSPVQIELARTFNPEQFKQDYAAYVNLARDYALKYGIPLTLDAGNMYTSGIKSHLWVTQNVWGDHTDPYGYLARFGVTKAQLAHDLVNGIGSSNGENSIQPPVAESDENLNTAGQIIGGKYMKLDTLNQNKAKADKLTNDYRKRYASYFLGKEVEAVPQSNGTYTITAKGLTHQQAVNLVPQFQRAVGGQVPNYKVVDTAGVIQPNGTYNIVASNIRTLNEAQKLVPALQQLSADALLSKRIYNGRQSKEGVYFTVILNLTLDQAVEFCAREKRNLPELGNNIMGNWQL